MKWTKNWGFTNSEAELHMLAHAERTRKRLAKQKKVRHTVWRQKHGTERAD